LEYNNHHVNIGDTRLYVSERGRGYPLIVLHGGPGFDHHSFGDYLDPLGDQFRLILVDQRSQGLSDKAPLETWSLSQMAADVVSLADALALEKYAVLGHSYGSLVTLQNAVDFPGKAAQSIISSGFPGTSYLSHVEENLANYEPEELRQKVADSWAREAVVQTPEEFADLWNDQITFHFKDAYDPIIDEFKKRTAGEVLSPDVIRHFAADEYGGIDVEDKLGVVTQPALVLAGRYDRVCSVPASQAIAAGIPNAELVIFENSAHMTFVEENQAYLDTVRKFLNKHM